jgi:hypothetical protein
LPVYVGRGANPCFFVSFPSRFFQNQTFVGSFPICSFASTISLPDYLSTDTDCKYYWYRNENNEDILNYVTFVNWGLFLVGVARVNFTTKAGKNFTDVAGVVFDKNLFGIRIGIHYRDPADGKLKVDSLNSHDLLLCSKTGGPEPILKMSAKECGKSGYFKILDF